jgi:hypothetical protein
MDFTQLKPDTKAFMKLIISSFTLVLLSCVLSTANAATPNKKYDCESCENEQHLDSCFKPCVAMKGEQWTQCVNACRDGKSRDECYTNCFPICENQTGAPIAKNANRGVANCQSCKGTVILVKDDMASDGSRIQVCKGPIAAHQ